MTIKRIIHLYNRVGFGISYSEAKALTAFSKEEIVAQLFTNSEESEPIAIDTAEFDAYIRDNVKPDRKKLRALIKKSAIKVNELGILWTYKLATTKAVFREKMTLFWSNHFVCHDKNIIHFKAYHEILRNHALGNFRDYLLAVSKAPSMIKYLNTRQNRKANPNENFARELLELFTLGRDNEYTETDIKEAARAFTGWNHDFRGGFRFRRAHHDYEKKTFLGETGYFFGEDIIDIILKQKQCARFICEKIYRYFVNDVLDASHVEEMTNLFYKDYDIDKLMRFVLLSDWFYDEKNIGVKIKSPIELLVGIHKVVPIQFKKQKQLIYIQNLLGQRLLFPPNVAGWAGGRNWIDANTMMLRLKLPSIILSEGEISLDEKGEFEDDFEMFNNKRNQRRVIEVDADWNAFKQENRKTSFSELKQQLILSAINSGTATYLEKLEVKSKKDYCIQLMSLPEYQLC